MTLLPFCHVTQHVPRVWALGHRYFEGSSSNLPQWEYSVYFHIVAYLCFPASYNAHILKVILHLKISIVMGEEAIL